MKFACCMSWFVVLVVVNEWYWMQNGENWKPTCWDKNFGRFSHMDAEQYSAGSVSIVTHHRNAFLQYVGYFCPSYVIFTPCYFCPLHLQTILPI